MILRGHGNKARFEQKFLPEPNTGCWLWEAGMNPQGYGVFWQTGRKCCLASRASYEIYVGLPPIGYEVDHLCRNRMCVNPDHLEAVPKWVNVLRGMGACAKFARRTHCKRGHALTEDNVYIRGMGGKNKKESGRRCRTCDLGRKKKIKPWEIENA